MKRFRICWLFLILHAAIFTACAQNGEITALRKQMAKAKDSLQYVDLLNQVGFLLHMNSPDSTFRCGIRGLQISERLGYRKGMADAYANLAAGLLLKGLYNQALSYYGKSYAAYGTAGDKAGMMQSLMNDAVAFDFIGDSIKREVYARRSINMARAMPTDSVTSMVYVNYTVLNSTLPADSINYYLQKATSIANHFHDERVILAIDQEEANLLLTKKDYAQALSHINRVLSVAASHHWDYHLLEGLNLLGNYQLALKQTDSAMRTYQRIYKTAIRDNFSFWQTEVLSDLIHCAELKKDVAQQLYYNKLLVTALQKNNDNIDAFIGDYINYTLAQENIRKLETANKNNTGRINWLIGLTIAGLLFTSLLVILYRRSRAFGKALSANDIFKDQLISILAHDFRAPLGSTLNMISLLRDGDMEKEEAAPLFDTLEQDIRNVLLTFDNLLSWIKAQAAGYKYQPQDLSLPALWEENVQFFHESVQTKGLSILMDIPDNLRIRTDKEILQFVNRNLLHNAIKYSPLNGKITISCSMEGNTFLTNITDEGPGMSAKELERLFSFKMDPGHSSNNGAGMAMTICKEFLAKLGGSIRAESTPGKGTRFVYTLPQ